MSSIPSPNLESVVRAGNTGSRVENITLKFIDISTKITDEIDFLLAYKAEAIEILQQIEDTKERVVLQEYFVSGKTHQEIADGLSLTVDWIKLIKRRGLDSAQIIIDSLEKNQSTTLKSLETHTT